MRKEYLIEIAKLINNCFDNGCGCCSRGDDDLDAAVEILEDLLREKETNENPTSGDRQP